MATPMTVYGDSISGNCLKVKFVADRLGVAYRWIETSVLKAETRTPEFLAMNAAGQVPLAVLADGRPIYEASDLRVGLFTSTDF